MSRFVYYLFKSWQVVNITQVNLLHILSYHVYNCITGDKLNPMDHFDFDIKLRVKIMKKKLWLMGFCIGILLIIFGKNIYNRLKEDKEPDRVKQDITNLSENLMITGEALRLLKFLGLNEEQLIEKLDIEKEQPIADEPCLTFGILRTVLDFVCTELNLDKQSIVSNLSFDIEKYAKNQSVHVEEFLNLYECLLKGFEEDKAPVKEMTMFVLGRPEDTKKNSEQTLVTDQGNYTYTDVVNYDAFYTDGVLKFIASSDSSGKDLEKLTDNEEGDNQTEKTENRSGKTENDSKDGTAFIKDNKFKLEDYVDRTIIAYVSGASIVYVKDSLGGETTLRNVYITAGKDTTVTAFLNDVTRDFKTKYKLSVDIKNQIGDLVIEDGVITKISIKPDRINGKVLVANRDFIEIQGYGKVELDEDYKIYKIYGEMSMEVTNSILVGYEATDFVVADGKIVAALIKEAIKAKDIRVLIKTNNYEDIFHDVVKITSNKAFTIKAGDVVKSYKAGQKVTLKPSNKLFKEGRLRIETKSENGKIQLLSINRANGNPSYRGAMEIEKAEHGLIVINELSIEEYLYAVIPSEMPSNYGLEALKVQAICARSYAFKQLFANGYSQYGAHVDDSVNYQVYNNIAENTNSILAVKDTYGKVIKYNDEVITAYYFSTSSGHTASINEVWGGNDDTEYLVGKMQTIYDVVDGEAVYASGGSAKTSNLSSEAAFKKFIKVPPKDTYDSEFAWYRWNVTISKENLKKSIDKNLANRYKANPDMIQTLVGGKVNDNPKYASRYVNTIGTVKDILIDKREKSGIISSIVLIGSECTVKVKTEYNIRILLAPIADEVIRQDKSKSANLSMLPSAFFTMDKSEKSITFYGGGYGHGVGMSQNGVKAMADSGKDYEEIIKHYYTGVEIGFIY